jgi:hypothetical protein
MDTDIIIINSSVLVPPVAILTLVNQTYCQGDTAVLECITVGGPNNTHQWQANGTNLDGEALPILRLFNITTDSGGEYTCVVSNPAGSHKASTFLFVYPYFLSHPGDVQVSLGSMIFLTCDAVGFPSPDYLWTRADGRIIRSDVSDGRVLNITDAQFEDGGGYSCHASGRGLGLQSQDLVISGITIILTIQLLLHKWFTLAFHDQLYVMRTDCESNRDGIWREIRVVVTYNAMTYHFYPYCTCACWVTIASRGVNTMLLYALVGY